MKLNEVMGKPNFKQALLYVQQHLIEHNDAWNVELFTHVGEPALRISAERKHKLEPDETKLVTLELTLTTDNDGDVNAWLNERYLPYRTPPSQQWDSEEALGELAALTANRMERQLARERDSGTRLAYIRDLERAHDKFAVTCPPHDGYPGAAFMDANSHVKFCVYTAATKDAPNYGNYGYLAGETNDRGQVVASRLKFYETITDVEKVLKRWLKANS